MGPTTFPTKEEIDRAAGIIRSGGLVAFPTETVYGLGANALDARAVERIYIAKGRPATSPLIVHVNSIAMAKSIVMDWPEQAALLAREFWPGPLTLVLPKRNIIPDNVTAGLPTVGVRMPSHPIALQLIESAGVPLAAPSANRFTKLSPTEARHVRESLGEAVDCILDGGPTQVGIESTVLSLVGGTIQLLRPGMVTAGQIERVVGPIATTPIEADGAHPSPGMHLKHYSPATKLLIGRQLPQGRVAYLWWKEGRQCTMPVRMPDDPVRYAHEIYGLLHKLDSENLDYIVIEPLPETEQWAGIHDRLSRAGS
jgi:L-threonylcarbamoyladenylate synthase